VEGIPTELIFVFIFIVFSILEGVGRKKKAERGRVSGEVQVPQRRSGKTRETGDLPPEVEVEEITPSTAEKTSEPDSSEGMIPEDVWAEILGLARGSPPEPKPTPKVETASEEREDTSWDSYRATEEASEVVVKSRPLPVAREERAITPADPARRTATAKRPLSPQGELPKGPRHLVRKELFGDGSAEELRKAVILTEVLGPPVGMRK
jgi:hypothetical protein